MFRYKSLTFLPASPHFVLIVVSCIVTKAFLVFAVLPFFTKLHPGLYNMYFSTDLYDQIAWNFVLGNGYRVDPDTSLTMLRSPGFVLILSAVFFLFGKSVFAIQIMNFVFSIVTAVMVFFLGKKLSASNVVASMAAALYFFFPGTLIAELRAGLESTQMLLIAATALLALRARESGKYSDYTMLGLVFGFNVLVKASVAFMLPIVLLYEFVRERSFSARGALIARYLVAGLMTVAVNAPWVIRNYQISGEFVPTMTVTGKSLYFGVYAFENFTPRKPLLSLLRESADRENKIAKELRLPFKEGYYPLFYRPVDEYKFYAKLGDLAMMKFHDNSVSLAKFVLFNSVAFWILGRTQMTTIINIAVALPVLVLFCCGVLIARRREFDCMVLLLPIVAYIIPHLFIAAQARYYIPIVPLMAVLMAFSLAFFSKNALFASKKCSKILK